MVWPGGNFEIEARYELRSGNGSIVQPAEGVPAWLALPTLDRFRTVFSQIPIGWQQWVDAWQRDPSRHESDRLLPWVAVLGP